MKPIQLKVPKGCLLDPSETAAVVGGNVLTSQRVVDVVFKAFETCAASQVTYIAYNALVLFLGVVDLECRVDQPCRVEIQHGMAVPGELKTKIFT